VQSGGKNIELAVMRKGETLKVNAILRHYKEFSLMKSLVTLLRVNKVNISTILLTEKKD